MTTMPDHLSGRPEWQETAEKKAQRVLAGDLKRPGWALEELARRGKGAAEKVTIARRLPAETTMAWASVAQQLSMGAPTSVADLLRKTDHGRTCDYAGPAPSRPLPCCRPTARVGRRGCGSAVSLIRSGLWRAGSGLAVRGHEVLDSGHEQYR
jgi:hypothetical protein